MRICRVEGCIKEARPGGRMCHMHVRRKYKYGTTSTVSAQGVHDPYERFQMQTKRMPNGCLEWQGTLSTRGYGQTKWNYKFYTTHRFSWELHNGPVPKGLWVLHKCDNPKCVDPQHLFVGTAKDNVRDAMNKGRMGGGEKNGNHKLDWELVKVIRTSKEDARVIAKRLGLNFSTIYRARNGFTWKGGHPPQLGRRAGNI